MISASGVLLIMNKIQYLHRIINIRSFFDFSDEKYTFHFQ
jgi:hypothetical protein